MIARDPLPLADRAAHPVLLSRTRVFDGFRDLDLFRLREEPDDPHEIERELLRCGKVAAETETGASSSSENGFSRPPVSASRPLNCRQS